MKPPRLAQFRAHLIASGVSGRADALPGNGRVGCGYPDTQSVGGISGATCRRQVPCTRTCLRTFTGWCVAAAALLFLSVSADAAPVSWSGRVVDARTGAPVPGIECYGGGRGRVDLTPKAITGADGGYVVTYDGPLDLQFWEFYALQATDPMGRYFTYRRSKVSLEPLLIRLVPKLAFIQGVVRDAVTGRPLANVEVSVGRPGVTIKTVVTGSDGRYSFNQPAYYGSTNVETIPEGERAEGYSYYYTVPITDYRLRIYLAGYRYVDTEARGLSLTLQSSITDAIHTQVDIALAPNGAAPGIENATAKLITPPAFRMTGSTLLNGEVGQALSYQISANNQPTSFIASGLSAGLALEPTTGLISGTPQTAGLFTVELSAMGAKGAVSERLTIVVRMTDGVVFDNGNIGGVQSGPTQPTIFSLTEPTLINFISNYHYFNGGVFPGTIALRHEDGTTYGPWQASGRLGQGGVANAYWDAWPGVVLKSGTYTVVDSHPATWSHNRQSGNRGFTLIKGSSTALDTAQILATWASNHGLAGEDATPTADPDHDNQPNWVELATGGNPALHDLATGADFSRIGDQLVVHIPLCAGGVGVPGGDFVINGVRVAIEVSPNLKTDSWQPGATLLDLANATRDNQGDGREILMLPVNGSPPPIGSWFVHRKLTRIESP